MVERRPAPFFIADHPALDFLNSTATPHTEIIEWLSTGFDLLDWLESSGMLDSGTARRFRTENRCDVLDAVAREARELREWLREFVARYAGCEIDASVLADLEPLNRLLAQDDAFVQVEAVGSIQGTTSALVCTKHRSWKQPEQLLQPIAEAIADCVCNVDFALVRRCENPACTLWFYDRTKNRTRRWCSMAVCGNRIKAAEYRARVKQARKP